MSTATRIEKNYYGVTIYVTTRTGREYACKVLSSEHTTGGGLDVVVQSWPGYGAYRGKVHLSRNEAQTLLKAYELEV